MSISSKHGKALDISGAFAFAALAMACGLYGSLIGAIGCIAAHFAFVCSFMSWRARENYDDLQVVRWRARCAFLAGFAVVIILSAIIRGVFA